MQASSVRAFLAAVALAAVGAGCGSESASGNAPADAARAIPVKVAAVLQRDLPDTVTLTGTLRPHDQVQVVAEVNARLLRVLKDEGAKVAAGETLAVLDETDYALSDQRAQAALAVAEANRAHAQAEAERAQNLVKTGGITDKDRLAADVGLKVADAALSQARAETAIAATQHGRTQVKAPFAGRVAKRMVDPGAMLTAGMPLFTLVSDSVLEFRAAVPSVEWGRVSVGAPVQVTIDGGHPPVTGRVARVSPLVDERTRTFDAVIEVPASTGLVGGLFAHAAIQRGQVTGALVVPAAALQRDGATPDEAHVFVVSGGKAERKVVKLGVEQPDAIQVVSGLALADQVVLDPPVGLTSGAVVDAKPAGVSR